MTDISPIPAAASKRSYQKAEKVDAIPEFTSRDRSNDFRTPSSTIRTEAVYKDLGARPKEKIQGAESGKFNARFKMQSIREMFDFFF